MTVSNSADGVAPRSSSWSPPEEFDAFRLVRLLGAGAMGAVYLAHDKLLERLVAVKFFHAGASSVARERVLDEARAIARLQHPNVAAIYRVTEFAGHSYLVSEYVHGRTLRELERPMAWRQVLAIALDLACGLAAAHRRGVLHRDVKPANAILTEDGRAEILDFGLALLMDGRPAAELATSHTEARQLSDHRTQPLDREGIRATDHQPARSATKLEPSAGTLPNTLMRGGGHSALVERNRFQLGVCWSQSPDAGRRSFGATGTMAITTVAFMPQSPDAGRRSFGSHPEIRLLFAALGPRIC